MKHERLAASVPAVFLLIIGAAPFAAPVSAAYSDQMCPAPISVCQPTIAGDPSIVPSPNPCPDGYSCVCVPSCPECADCAAQVCMPSPRECKTACDCDPGLGCFEGRCIAGFAPVFCCERDECPSFGVCQSQSGEYERCDGPMCERRLRLSRLKIKRVVRRASRCETANQCVRVDTGTQCRGSCGAWVNRLYAQPVERIVGRIDRRICDGYQADGCPYATPGCLAERGVCRRGRCRGVPAG
jgi:hypothetical protein